MKKDKNLRSYRKQIYKQPPHFSGLLVVNLLKRFSQLKRVLYGDAMLVNKSGPPIWRPAINENIWSSLCDEKCLLFAHEIKYMYMNTFLIVNERLKLLRFKEIDIWFSTK